MRRRWRDIIKDMENKLQDNLSNENEGVNISIIENSINHLRTNNEKEGIILEEDWEDFESSILKLGFSKVENEDVYFQNLATLHPNDVFVRRADAGQVLSNIEQNKSTDIQLFDTEPNATVIGPYAEGVGSALQSGFGWVVYGQVAGVIGFINESSNLSIKDIPEDSPSNKKEHGDLMRCISGKLLKEDILFSMFRIHKSVFPEDLLEERDYIYEGKTKVLKNFINRLYKKTTRQTH